MKKLMIAMCMFLGFAFNTSAQTITHTEKAKTSKTTKVEKKVTKTTTGPKKEDGSLDMRYKANKAKPAGPLKADGTPDKRYNANKKAKK